MAAARTLTVGWPQRGKGQTRFVSSAAEGLAPEKQVDVLHALNLDALSEATGRRGAGSCIPTRAIQFRGGGALELRALWPPVLVLALLLYLSELVYRRWWTLLEVEQMVPDMDAAARHGDGDPIPFLSVHAQDTDLDEGVAHVSATPPRKVVLHDLVVMGDPRISRQRRLIQLVGWRMAISPER